ncbi:hypothetical protein BDR26DRAFT_930586 [Obelidium mucronatum]|nr:hypothetical protein BDR26DRAFT_930586 [Obelidium mucronatum]
MNKTYKPSGSKRKGHTGRRKKIEDEPATKKIAQQQEASRKYRARTNPMGPIFPQYKVKRTHSSTPFSLMFARVGQAHGLRIHLNGEHFPGRVAKTVRYNARPGVPCGCGKYVADLEATLQSLQQNNVLCKLQQRLADLEQENAALVQMAFPFNPNWPNNNVTCSTGITRFIFVDKQNSFLSSHSGGSSTTSLSTPLSSLSLNSELEALLNAPLLVIPETMDREYIQSVLAKN